MGILGLMKLLSEEAPAAIKETEFENYTGRKIAIDASMAMYQFLIAVRSAGQGQGGKWKWSSEVLDLDLNGLSNPLFNTYPLNSYTGPAVSLTNENGDVTSHIQGMFNRTIKMMAAGMKPVYVFDGKPPNMKGGELEKRTAKRNEAEKQLAAAQAEGEGYGEN